MSGTKMKEISTLGLAILLFVGIMTSCGEEETAGDKKEKLALTGEVNIVAAEGTPYTSVSKLPDEYKVIKEEDTAKVKETLIAGNCDFAVLPVAEASKLFNTKGGFKLVTTVSLGKWQVASKGTVGTNPLSFLAGRKIYGLEKDKGKDVTQTSEEVLKALMVYDKKNLYTGQMTWMEEEDFLKNGKIYGVTSMAQSSVIDKLMDEDKDVVKVISVEELWQDNFKNDVPEYVLVARDEFLSARGDEVEVILNDMAASLEEAQKNTDDKLVVYNTSNRGVDLVKKFNEVMKDNNINAIGGKVLPVEYYFYR